MDHHPLGTSIVPNGSNEGDDPFIAQRLDFTFSPQLSKPAGFWKVASLRRSSPTFEILEGFDEAAAIAPLRSSALNISDGFGRK